MGRWWGGGVEWVGRAESGGVDGGAKRRIAMWDDGFMLMVQRGEGGGRMEAWEWGFKLEGNLCRGGGEGSECGVRRNRKWRGGRGGGKQKDAGLWLVG